MARRTGTPGPEFLGGTRKSDLILGRGGYDTLRGKAGDDVLVGFGKVLGEAGDDEWFAIDQIKLHDPGFLDTPQIEADLGRGRDLAVLHDHQGDFFNRASVPHVALDMGTGDDGVVLASLSYDVRVDLGRGRDVADVLTEGRAEISLGDGGGGRGDDGDRDVIRVSAHGEDVSLFDFGRNDVLKIHDSGLRTGQLVNLAEFVFGSGTTVRFDLPTGRTITVVKTFDGDLTSRHVQAERGRLVVEGRAHREDDAGKSKVAFGSGSDDALSAKGKTTLYLGAGDDVGRGTTQRDVMHGGSGDDRLLGRKGNDRLEGGLGDDRLVGGGGDDLLRTGLGDDVAFGGSGNNRFLIDGGDADLRAAGGRDVFRFTEAAAFDASDVFQLRTGGGPDRIILNGLDRGTVVIHGFVSGQDKIDLAGSLGGNLTAQVVFEELSVAAFIPGVEGLGTRLNFFSALDVIVAGVAPQEFAPTDFLD